MKDRASPEIASREDVELAWIGDLAVLAHDDPFPANLAARFAT